MWLTMSAAKIRSVQSIRSLDLVSHDISNLNQQIENLFNLTTKKTYVSAAIFSNFLCIIVADTKM